MRELPLLMSGPMVCATRDDLKTQTRRIILPQPDHVHKIDGRWDAIAKNPAGDECSCKIIPCPYGQPGDLLYVREKFAFPVFPCGFSLGGRFKPKVAFATMPESERRKWVIPGWKPSIHMPKKYARLWLRVTEVRVERLTEISEADAKAEGVPDCQDQPFDNSQWCPKCQGQGVHGAFGADYGVTEVDCDSCDTAIKLFRNLWDSLNAKPKPIKQGCVIISYVSYPWDDIRETREYRGKPWLVIGNPHVRCISFERGERP